MTYVEDRRYFPDGCDPDHYEATSFSIHVTYRGGGKWGVFQGGPHQQMTKTGKWTWMPERMTQTRWCRFTFDEACALAERHINDVTVNGKTWAEWEVWRAAQRTHAARLAAQRPTPAPTEES